MADVGDIFPGTGERIVGKVKNPNGPGYWLQGEYGGVFAVDDNLGTSGQTAPSFGSYFSLDPVHRNDPNRRFTGIEAVEGGGYRSISANPNEAAGYTFRPPPAGTQPAATNTPPPPSAADIRRTGEAGVSAKGTLAATLAKYGLPASLADTLWGQWYVNEGRPLQQILIDLEDTNEFKQRFPGITALKERRNRGEAVQVPSVTEYVELEVGIASVLKDAGLPANFYDGPEDYGKWIGGSTSPKEVQDRIALARNVAFSMPVEVREELNRVYDIDQGELIAFVINPDRALPEIQKRIQGAAIGGAAKRVGFGLLTAQEMEQLAGSGVTDAQATQRFGELAQGAALFDELAGETEDLGRTEQVGFASGNVEAEREIARRRQGRQALFGGGGGATGGAAGGTGLGST